MYSLLIQNIFHYLHCIGHVETKPLGTKKEKEIHLDKNLTKTNISTRTKAVLNTGVMIENKPSILKS